MADGKWTMRPFFKGLVILIIAAGAVPCLLVAFAMSLRFYSLNLAPPRMNAPVPSPDGKYAAAMGFRGFMDEYNHMLYLQEGKGRRRWVWEHMVDGDPMRECADIGETVWSPDSSYIAVGRMWLGRRNGGSVGGWRRRDVPYVGYSFSLYDVRKHRRVHKHADIALNLPLELTGVRFTWKWLGADKILLSMQYDADKYKVVHKTVGVLEINGSGSELRITRHPGTRLQGTEP